MSGSSRAALALGLLSLVASVGCGSSPSSRIIGKWEVDAQKMEEAMAAAAKSNPMAGMMAGALKSMKFDVEFKSGGALSFQISAMGQSRSVNGTYKVVKSSGNEVTLAVKTDGETTDKQITIKVVDSNTIEFVPPGPSGASGMQQSPMTFKRAKA